MIAQTLQTKIAEALKAHDAVKLSTLRMLSSAFSYEKIEKQHELTDEEEFAVVAREAKKRKEAIEAYEKAGANNKALQEKQELVILEEFLPGQISDKELEKIVIDVIHELNPTDIKQMGIVISAVKSKVGVTAEGGKIAELVKQKLL